MIRRESLEVLLTELNTTDEGEELEAKTISGRELGRSVFETICALCNEPDLEGGTILLGVSKEDALFPLYHVTGITEPDKLSSDLATGCATMFNQPVRIDVKALNFRGSVVLKIDVPEVPKSQKPVYFKSIGLPKGAFRRVGPTDIKCTDEDLALFYQGGSSDPFDVRIVRDATWSDIDPAAIAAYRKARAEVNPLAEELHWSDEDILYALSSIKRLDDKIKITTTGLLIFGRGASIRRLFPAHRVDYIRIPGKAWVQDLDGKFESIDMRGPMMTLISRVIAAIADDLPKTLRIEDNKSGQRTETPVLPFRVIREAVVNALMHRSY
ncbi:RNA-binding domain-containing protein [Methylobacterium sp. GC_Met_2]|uniref:AlbA family DNA-binding domain-containing protein n=1 Tax=Methylobacterium sp. GC_Met_2 TaxID=2937376 RepID=UPI00226BAF2E|nr:RNA-binding domain-containing protein [Methylobacterium sp. GC_Met_2]